MTFGSYNSLIHLQILCRLELQFPRVDIEPSKRRVQLMRNVVLILRVRCAREETIILVTLTAARQLYYSTAIIAQYIRLVVTAYHFGVIYK